MSSGVRLPGALSASLIACLRRVSASSYRPSLHHRAASLSTVARKDTSTVFCCLDRSKDKLKCESIISGLAAGEAACCSSIHSERKDLTQKAQKV